MILKEERSAACVCVQCVRISVRAEVWMFVSYHVDFCIQTTIIASLTTLSSDEDETLCRGGWETATTRSNFI